MADDAELRRLIAHALRFHLQSEQLALMFDRELEQVWRAWKTLIERLVMERMGAGDFARSGLQLRAGQVIGLRSPLRMALNEAGFDTTVTGAVTGAMARWMTIAGVPRQSIRTTVETLHRLATTDLLQVGDTAATQLWRALAQAVLSPRAPSEIIIADLAKTLDRTQAQAATLFDTQMTIFGRTVEEAATEALGPEQPFLFAGPVDLKTRDFCLEHVGKVYTRAEIDELDNGQLPNTFLTGGGYNCRHTWMAVEGQALRSLSGTGDRAEGFQPDVNHVREQKRKAA